MNYMLIEVEEDKITHLYREYKRYEADESYYFHLANYLINQLEKSHPQIYDKTNQ